MTTPTSCKYWRELGEFLLYRIKKPVGHPTYWFYFILVLLGAGGIGVWKAIFFEKSHIAIASNLMTFFPAVAAASAFEIVLNDKLPKSAKSFTMVIGGVLIGAVIYIWVHESEGAVKCAVVATLIASLLWWIANAENYSLLDSDPTAASLGNDTNVPMSGNLGDLNG
jgi:hypothetical protein